MSSYCKDQIHRYYNAILVYQAIHERAFDNHHIGTFHFDKLFKLPHLLASAHDFLHIISFEHLAFYEDFLSLRLLLAPLRLTKLFIDYNL